MRLHELLEQHWQQPKAWLTILLRPLSRLFAVVVARRRAAYVSGQRVARRLTVPVVVVGNIHVGGTGKTPIVVALVKSLQQCGVRVGVISRGYGRSLRDVHIVRSDSRVDETGDEPLLLYRQTGVPMAVGAVRYDAGCALLAHYPELELIVADDGLQHYDLARDVEICVFPASDIGRDLAMLPQGALREPMSRLASVDYVIVSGGNEHQVAEWQQKCRLPAQIGTSMIHVGAPYRYNQPQEMWCTGSLQHNAHCVAIAGIARPERFFTALREQGIVLMQTIVLPDHASLRLEDIPQADCVFITEKDAVKLPNEGVPDSVWVLPIRAELLPDWAQQIAGSLHLL